MAYSQWLVIPSRCTCCWITFGLDVADIESYGSASKIIKKNWKVAALASDMARGFCAWFILQHLRGYKPFITIMEKEQILKFKI